MAEGRLQGDDLIGRAAGNRRECSGRRLSNPDSELWDPGAGQKARSTNDPKALSFPVIPVQPLPLHALHKVCASATIPWYRITDGGLKQAA